MDKPFKRGNWTDNACFYASATDAGKLALILGPFQTEEECREWAYTGEEDGGNFAKAVSLRNACHEMDPKSVFYAYGMVKTENGYRDGIFNAKFGL